MRGFRAYELFLEAHPEYHGRVQMLALLDPSRQEIPEYAEYLGAIQRAARVVNDRFQQEGWVPLELSIQDNFHQAVAAYKQFDVVLVNAIFDGLNLVAKEAPLVNTRDGVLILSENAGAHEELGEWALTVNPFDVAEQAEAIHTALTMPVEERRERLGAIKRQVRGTTSAAGSTRSWTTSTRPRSAPDLHFGLRLPAERQRLSHVDEAGEIRMVDVGGKPQARRRASAACPRADAPRDGGGAPLAPQRGCTRDRAGGRDHGREAHRRAHPPLPSAPALPRGRRSRRGGRGRGHRPRTWKPRPRPASRWKP